MRKEVLVALLKEGGIEIDRDGTNGWVIGHCPFAPYNPAHKSGRDGSASFCVKSNPAAKSGFNCYTCKASGAIPKLFTWLYHYTKDEKYNQLAVKAALNEFSLGSTREFDQPQQGLIKPRPLSEKVWSNVFPPAWQSEEARNYLQNRRDPVTGKLQPVTEQTCQLLGILFDDKEKRVVFPVRDRENKLYGFTGRTILPEKQWKAIMGYGKVKDYGFDEGDINNPVSGKKQFFLLGSHLVDLTKPILLVEGLFALARMLEIGADKYVQPVASMGANLSNYQTSILEMWGKPVYLLYDKDGAGIAGLEGTYDAAKKYTPGAMMKLWQLVPTYRCLWPQGYSDPDALTLPLINVMIKRAKRVAY